MIKKSLDTQKSVVIEEFKQRYLNVPYGDVWLKLRPLAYKVHPYQWATIGKDISHIQEASLQDVHDFHSKYYCPNNAILTISGNIDTDKTYEWVEKWFGGIPSSTSITHQLPVEPAQNSERLLGVQENIPLDAIYKTYHMPGRGSKDYLTADLLSDLMGRGNSSRLHQSLVKEKKIFNSINAYILGTADPGLLVISGKVNPTFNLEDVDNIIAEEIELLKTNLHVSEVEKVINQSESSNYFSETELLNRSISLSVANSLGDTDLVNKENKMIREIKDSDILSKANSILVDTNCSTLYYKSKK